MAYFSTESILQSKQMDLLTYLQTFEPGNLVRISENTYCTKEHDSLKISNGKWHWFSQGIGGRSALDYLMKVKGYSFIQAVETILSANGTPVYSESVKPVEKPKQVLLAERNENTDYVSWYLMSRGIDAEIIRYCISEGLLYESKEYHNAVFLGFDADGKVRYGSVRSTRGRYKGELTGSCKRYSFRIAGHTDHVHVFESAIDALSYGTLLKREGKRWNEATLLSLAGVFIPKRADVVPVALEQFLQDHPEIRTIHLHLDNDTVGRGAAAGIIGGLRDKYIVLDEPPNAKDVNDELKMRLGILPRKKVIER